ncbi:uncharacterized protein LOC110827512 isoform X3 [Zootermopsis nevadensis]|uniref:uncharacterized protein LOC110827512 isoform X3 n=1 Tax=Zootermopsis nevadensis TaxID=136037 RepID=UPI000B8EB206|nr:uncharacterized protein LOC110827512 isoform X3 [Zootermopsis nevadensis]
MKLVTRLRIAVDVWNERMDVSGDVTSLRKKAVIISFSPFDSGLSEADHFSAFFTSSRERKRKSCHTLDSPVPLSNLR